MCPCIFKNGAKCPPILVSEKECCGQVKIMVQFGKHFSLWLDIIV